MQEFAKIKPEDMPKDEVEFAKYQIPYVEVDVLQDMTQQLRMTEQFFSKKWFLRETPTTTEIPLRMLTIRLLSPTVL